MDAFLQLGNFYVDLISILVVVIIIASIIYGSVKGFMAGLIALGKGLVVVLMGILFAKPLAALLNSFGLGEVIANGIGGMLQGLGEPFTYVIDEITDKAAAIQMGLEKIMIPESIASLLATVLQSLIPDSGTETLGVYFASALSDYAVISIAFFIIETICAIIVAILMKIAKKVSENKVTGPINRVLGAILYAVLAYLIIDAVMFALSFMTIYVESVGPWITKTMYLDEANSEIFTISKFIYNNGIVRKVVEMLIAK